MSQGTSTDRALIGALMTIPDPSGLWAKTGRDVFRGKAGVVAGAIARLIEAGHPCDMVTVAADLEERGHLEDAGGHAWIAMAVTEAPGARTADALADSLHRIRCWDEVLALGKRASELATSQTESDGSTADEMRKALDELRGTIDAISSRAQWRHTLPVGCVADDATLAPIGSLDEHFQPYMGGLLRCGMVSIISGPSKSGKSFLSESIAMHAAAGEPFLGYRFDAPLRVLVIDWELRRLELLERFNLMARSYGIEIARGLSMAAMKEHTGAQDVIANRSMIISQAKKMKADIIILDCLYMMKPDDTDENSNSEMGQVMKAIDRIAIETHAAVLLVHHMGKGNKADVGAMDAGAGAGVIGRLVSCASIAMKAHEQDGCWCLQWGGRQIKSGGTVVERHDYAFEERGDLSFEDAKVVNAKRKPAIERVGPEDFAERYIGERSTTSQIVGSATRDGMNASRVRDLIKEAVASGHAFCVAEARRGSEACYSVTEGEPVESVEDRVRELIESNPMSSTKKIAEEIGVSKSTIYNIMKRIKQ